MRITALLLLFAASAASAFTVPFDSSFVHSPVAGPVRAPVTRGSSSRSHLCMKTIAVIGASGLTASECVYQGLKEGDTIIGLTRNPSNVRVPKGSGGSDADKPLTDPNLVMIGGDVTNASDVAKVFEGRTIEGVIVALGGKTADVGETMLTDGTNVIIDAMKKNGCSRLSVVTSIGAGDSENQAPFFFKILMMTAMKKIFTDKNKQEDAVRASGLDYCIVRPGGLSVDPPTGVINVVEGEAGSITRADVASFCLDSVKVEDFPYIGKAPCISSVAGTSWVKDRSAKARGMED